MIHGYATPEDTKAYTEHRIPSGIGTLGTTDLTVTQAGFGCYRISTGVAAHEKALKSALFSGINLIDTSTNYADGGSEALVGQVLKDLHNSKAVLRQNIVVISKVGYLQGQNFTLSQQRKKEGRPFPDLVEFGKGLEHCIHPEFIQDQLDRSLGRLGLETLDGLLLHNPEYYLNSAAARETSLEESRDAYYQRIQLAFEHLEEEVARGRIRFYGISSNTFPAVADDPEFTSLEKILDIADAVSSGHHFRLIQFPLNILEPGAVLKKNQPDGSSVLELAYRSGIGVLVNRPLNGFAHNQLFRLADVREKKAQKENDIIQRIRAVGLSEAGLWRRILPKLDLQHGLVMRIKEQISIGDGLKHMWRNFGSYERWRQVRDGNFKPRVQGVMDFLSNHTEAHPEVTEWMVSHEKCLDEAYGSVGSIYGEAAAVLLSRIHQDVSGADPDWETGGTMSQKAVRTVRSSLGVSSVLVGMRKTHYVEDVLQELRRPVVPKDRLSAWAALNEKLKDAF